MLKKAHFHFFQITFVVSLQDLTILSFKGYMMTETLVVLTIECQHNNLFVRLMFSSYFMQSSGLGYFFFYWWTAQLLKHVSPFLLFSRLPYTEKKYDNVQVQVFVRRGRERVDGMRTEKRKSRNRVVNKICTR